MNQPPETNGQANTNGQPFPPFTNGGNSGRGARGRFTRGNQAAKGHAVPFSRHQARLRLALFASFTDEDMKAIVAKLVRMVVENGDLAAAEFLFRYCIGPGMTFNVNPDDVDVLELERLRNQAQTDALGNSRLTPQAAVVLERAYQSAATVGTLGEELSDWDSSVGPHLLAALKDAGLHELLRAAKAYSSTPSEGDRHDR
jgi:hypothetical protein